MYIRGHVDGARLYWLDAKFGCGGVYVRNGKIVGGAAIFSKLAGQDIKSLPKWYRVKKV